MISSRIVSFGSFVPSQVVKNKDLEKLMNSSDEWIQQRSGILERRWVQPGETLRSMAAKASKKALERAGWTGQDIDAIIFSTLLSDYVFPGTGVLLQHDLGCSHIPAFDIRNQCSGFLYALQMADSFIRSGTYKRVLICAGEIHSTSINKSPEGRDVGVLFGDAASACLLEAAPDSASCRVIDILIYSQGEHAEKLALLEPSPNNSPRIDAHTHTNKNIYPVMDGRFVFKNAVDRMVESIHAICKKNAVELSDVSFVIPHQANKRINQSVLEHLGISEEKTHYTIDRFANTTSATIPLTFDEALEKQKIKRGDLVLLSAFGSGFTWGASLIKY